MNDSNDAGYDAGLIDDSDKMKLTVQYCNTTQKHVIPTLSVAKTEGPYDGQSVFQPSTGILLPMAA